jgi:NAD(P)-dependent dehydrogenase (short-subunit alcohol dehydrogenase family)
MRTLAECEQISSCVLIQKADVSKCDEAARLVHRAVDEFGRLDVLINNAARVADKPVLEMTENEWDSVVDVSMKGAFLCSQAAARQMLGQDDGGTILNIGASTGITARRNGINTCASKAGLMIMTQCLALELSPKIRVNTIIPGLTVTAETERRFSLDDPAVRSQREGAIPLQRIGQPTDVAAAVMLMLSDDAGFITGQKLVVNGGQYMW